MNNIPTLVAQKSARDGKLYSQTEIAESTGLSPSMISRLVRGKVNMANITLGVAVVLSEWLECKVEDLYAAKEQQPT